MDKLELINREVLRSFSISSKDTRGKSRKKEILFARYAGMYIARYHLEMSLERIGNYFNRDHTTVMNALKKTNNLLETVNVFKNNLYMAWYNVRESDDDLMYIDNNFESIDIRFIDNVKT